MNMGKEGRNAVSIGSSIGCLAFAIRVQICILIRTHVLRAKHSAFDSLCTFAKKGGIHHYLTYFSAACE
jgi:hypothetical protein